MKRPGGFDRLPEPQEQPPPRRPIAADAVRGEPARVDPTTTGSALTDPALTDHESIASSVTPNSPSAVDTGPDGAGSAPESAAIVAPETLHMQETQPLSRFGVPRRPADPIRAAERRLREAERQHKRSKRRETRRFTAAIRRTRQRTFVIVGAILALVIFVVIGAYTPLMAVRTIEVDGATHVNVDEVQIALQRFDGVPLALVDENEVLRALESFPLIQRFAVERVPPHTLRIRIEERLPVIAVEQDGSFRHYDAAGVLVGESAEATAGVPVASGSILNTASPAFREAAQVLRDVPVQLREQVVAVTSSSGQDVSFTLSSGIDVFWGSSDETKKKSVILQTMLASLEGRTVSHVDVSSTSAPIFK